MLGVWVWAPYLSSVFGLGGSTGTIWKNHRNPKMSIFTMPAVFGSRVSGFGDTKLDFWIVTFQADARELALESGCGFDCI